MASSSSSLSSSMSWLKGLTLLSIVRVWWGRGNVNLIVLVDSFSMGSSYSRVSSDYLIKQRQRHHPIPQQSSTPLSSSLLCVSRTCYERGPKGVGGPALSSPSSLYRRRLHGWVRPFSSSKLELYSKRGGNNDDDDDDDDDDDFVIVEEELNLSEEQTLQNKIKRRRRKGSSNGSTASSLWSGDDQPTSSSSSGSGYSMDYDADDVELSPEQATALEYIRAGHNVFITGVAGTGKSLVLKRALQDLSERYRPKQYVAVAPTGSVAVSLEGQTIHSFAGIGVPKTWNDFYRSKSKTAVADQWKKLKVLVLDEVSMVSGEFFDSLSHVVSEIRQDPRPFGGIQLVVCGDFLQLSPIAPREADVDQMIMALLQEDGTGSGSTNDMGGSRTPEQRARDQLFLNRGYCFQSVAWEEANFKVVDLQKVFRQENTEFVGILRQIRTGQVTEHTEIFLKENCERPLPPNEYGIRPTILHSKNLNVAQENLAYLDQLAGEEVVYPAVDEVQVEKGVGKWAEKVLEGNSFFTACIAEKELRLKIGAQVMLIKNMNNRSKLVNGSRGTIVGFRSGTKDGPELPGITKYPVVQFINGSKQVVMPGRFQSRLVGLGTCSRTAVPLKLAWAITTHKAQGLTLDYVIADVGKVFADAQLYVALSRASDERGLELRNFSKGRVRANNVALKFYQDANGDGETRQYPFWWEEDGQDGTPMIFMSSSGKVKRRRMPKVKRITDNQDRSGSDSSGDRNGVRDRVGSVAPTQRNKGKPVTNPSSLSSALSSPGKNGLTATTLRARTVPELKEMLRQRGLKVSGTKTDLIERLTN